MNPTMCLQVPIEDQAELDALGETVPSAARSVEVRAFDAVAVAQLVLALTATVLPVVKTWIRERARERKAFKILFQDMELHGYTPEEAEKIIEILSAASTPRPDDEE